MNRDDIRLVAARSTRAAQAYFIDHSESSKFSLALEGVHESRNSHLIRLPTSVFPCRARQRTNRTVVVNAVRRERDVGDIPFRFGARSALMIPLWAGRIK